MSSLVLTLLLAQAGAPPSTPFRILDNSFLVEEAFNQERGVFQNIFGFTRVRAGEWEGTFTQEWPAPGMRHQFSYTLSWNAVQSRAAAGDALVNYRVQVMEEEDGRPAFAPRLSAIVPSGRQSTGGGNAGAQVNLPFSKRAGRMYFHWNGGVTWLPRNGRTDLVSPALAGSAIYALRPMFNLMLESALALEAGDTPAGRVERTRSLTVAPGVRGGWNVMDDKQIVVGAALPITRVNGDVSTGVFAYFSYELRFTR